MTRTTLALAIAAIVVVLVLAYFFYVGCEISAWRTLLIETGRCAKAGSYLP